MSTDTKAAGTNSRIRRRRHLDVLFKSFSPLNKSLGGNSDISSVSKEQVLIPQEFTPHQYAIFLLHVAAELEHVLMIQYLYAGYSLGGPHVPLEHHHDVPQWRETILGIAKEEMGHLMTMQNLLRCLGGPLNLDREDFPWDSEFYPFPFKLEPLTRESLAKYIVVEAPADWSGEEAEEIKAIAKMSADDATLHRVGLLFETIQKLLEDDTALKDIYFQSSTYPFQATWDEWGRGYHGGARGNSVSGQTAMPGTPDVILMSVTSRTDTLEALKAVATQGEAAPSSDENAPSHFARFLRIFRGMPKDGAWSATRGVPEDPIAVPDFIDNEEASLWDGAPITHPESKCWAHLLNTRYHLLLNSLLHTYDFSNNLTDGSQVSPRGLLIHATFGEMYNLRAISEILVQSPLNEEDSDKKAGPPFQMPFTLKQSHDQADRWQHHLDLLETSRSLIDQLKSINSDLVNNPFLQTCAKIDAETAGRIQAILRK